MEKSRGEREREREEESSTRDVVNITAILIPVGTSASKLLEIRYRTARR